MIKQKFSNYNIIDSDCVQATFEKILPQANINHFGGSGMIEDFLNFVENYLNIKLKDIRKYSTIFLKTVIIFLGYSPMKMII